MRLFAMIMMTAMACSVAACGTKGSLKSPSQIEAERAKEQHRQEREARRKTQQAEEQKVQ